MLGTLTDAGDMAKKRPGLDLVTLQVVGKTTINSNLDKKNYRKL